MGADQFDGAPRRARTGGLYAALAAGLLFAVLLVASPRIDAHWTQGDEYHFIVNNPDVTGKGRSEPWFQRFAGIFTRTHGDLYQPLPVLTYAMEWSLWGDAPAAFRRTDLVLHALNALLLWLVLAALLRTFAPALDASTRPTLAWSLALLWAVHPAAVAAASADMGRTHLLSATFSLLALHAHLKFLRDRTGAWLALTFATFLLALLCKPIVGWVIVLFALESAVIGWRSALRSLRIYALAVLAVAFGALAVFTSQQAGLIEEIGGALFGDPIARSLRAVTLYVRLSVWPINLAAWYPPDIRVGWDYAPVWIGAALTFASIAAILLAARSAAHTFHPSRPGASTDAPYRITALGILWFWAMLLPVLGLVGARFSAAEPRYLYHPLMGLVAALGGLAAGLATRRMRADSRVLKPAAVVVALVAIALIQPARSYCALRRSTLERAMDVAARSPEDPRTQEMLAAAYEFCGNHPQAAYPHEPEPQAFYFAQAQEAYHQAASRALNGPEYFSTAHAYTAFLRRLSFRLLALGDARGSAGLAEAAYTLEPNSSRTLTRLAHAYRALHDWPRARKAYERLEQSPPDDPQLFAIRETEFGDLLIQVFGEPDAAAQRYQRALETGAAPPRAAIGLARCRILSGALEDGFALIQRTLAGNSDNPDALVVAGLYHMAKEDWPAAQSAFQAALAASDPAASPDTRYEALRGLQEMCAQLGDWSTAVQAWDRALRADPENAVYQSFHAWALACADDPGAAKAIQAILESAPHDPLACYARMLLALRAGDVRDALKWIEQADQGHPLPEAREPQRAERTLDLLIERGNLRTEARIAQAALLQRLGNLAAARELLRQVIDGAVNPEAQALAAELLAGLEQAETP